MLGDGKNTSFWFDPWLGERPLAEVLPSLRSLCRRPNLNVTAACSDGTWSLPLSTQDLSSQASLENQQLVIAPANATPMVGISDRRGVGKQIQPFSSSAFYSLYMNQVPVEQFTSLVWCNTATPCGKQFMWACGYFIDRGYQQALFCTEETLLTTQCAHTATKLRTKNTSSFDARMRLEIGDAWARISFLT